MKFLAVNTYYAARKLAPNAAVVARAEGGFIAFATMAAYGHWIRTA